MKLETIQFLQNFLLVTMLYLPIVTVSGFLEALIATWCGDDVPSQAGFITLDPWVHVSPFGYLFALFTSIPVGRLVPLSPEVLLTVRKRYAWVGLFFIRPAVHFLQAVLTAIILGLAFQVDLFAHTGLSFLFNANTLAFTLSSVVGTFYWMHVLLTVLGICLALSRTLVFFLADTLRLNSFTMLAISMLSFFIFVMLLSPYMLVGVQLLLQAILNLLHI